MKNLFVGLFLLIILFCSSVLAADISSMGGKWGIGAVGTTPTLKINFTDSVSLDMGLGYVAAPSNLTGAPGIVNTLLFLNLATEQVGSGGMNMIGWGFLGRYTANAGNVNGDSSMSVG